MNPPPLNADQESLLKKALQTKNKEEAFQILEPLRVQSKNDLEAARTWAMLLSGMPSHPRMKDDVNTMLTDFAQDQPLLLSLAELSVRLLELRPDEPHPLVKECKTLRERLVLPPHHRLMAYLEHIVDPAEAVNPHFAELITGSIADAHDLGLLYKWKHNFTKAALVYDRIHAPSDHPLAAAIAWNKQAMNLLSGATVPSFTSADLPLVLVRIPIYLDPETVPNINKPAAGFEIVRVKPTSPMSGVIETPLTHQAVVEVGDHIVWDGIVVGAHQSEPVFPFLGVVQKHEGFVVPFWALEQDEGQTASVFKNLEHTSVYFFPAQVDLVCSKCASGLSMQKHEHEAPTAHRYVSGKIWVHRELNQTETQLREACQNTPGVLMAFPKLYELLSDSKEAGKHHQRLGAVRRKSAPISA